MWKAINQSVDDDARLGATDDLQRMRPNGSIEDITDPEEMNTEIQYVMEQRFDLAHSIQITMSFVADKVGYLSDTEFAQQLLSGQVAILLNVGDTTAIVQKEIAGPGMIIQSFVGERLVITLKKF